MEVGKDAKIITPSRTYIIPIAGTLLFLGLTALLIIIGMTTWLGLRSEEYFSEIVRVRDFRSAVVELRSSLQASETSQRGYLLTGNEIYLGPFGLEKSIAERNTAALSSVIPSTSPQSFSLSRLKTVIQDKFAEMDQTIALKRERREADVIAIIKTNKGKRLTDEANVYFSGLVTYADQRLAAASDEQSRNFSLLQAASLIGGIVIVLVAAIAALMVSRHTRAIAQSRDEVQTLNANLERRVRERTAHLAELNEEVRRFAYIVTHDLRAPLVNIMGFTREIEESIKTVAPLAKESVGAELSRSPRPAAENPWAALHVDIPEAISFIKGSTQKMDALINAILKLSREGQRRLRVERLDLQELTKATVASLQHNLTHCGGRVEFGFAVREIVADRVSIEQIVTNLIDNAIKYRSADRSLVIVVGSRRVSDRRVVVFVTDNGRGISEADRERVFELFRRSGIQDQKGDGIGLAHVRTLVRNLGGEITLASQIGQGTTFSLDLPLVVSVEEHRSE